MIKGVIHLIFLAESALNCIDTSILVFYQQGRWGRRDIRLRPRPAWPVRPPAVTITLGVWLKYKSTLQVRELTQDECPPTAS